MKLSLLAAALISAQALAGTQLIKAPIQEPTNTFKHFSGSFTVGAETNYVGRGLVVTSRAAEGCGAETLALKTNYALGEDSPWSFENTIAYKIVSEGHTLYGNPHFGPDYNDMGLVGPIKECNMENEFAVLTAAHYRQEEWNIAFGHKFVRGGLLGVMAKHYRDQSASVVNEVFIAPEWTPEKWLSVGCTTSFSFQGITGWWFEPYVTLKARIIGDEQKTVLAALCTFSMSATADYFAGAYNACVNGSQAYWIKLATPWFVNDNVIITPSVSFNWAGHGALKGNKLSEFKEYSQDPSCKPFRNFGVVGSISVTYKF